MIDWKLIDRMIQMKLQDNEVISDQRLIMFITSIVKEALYEKKQEMNEKELARHLELIGGSLEENIRRLPNRHQTKWSNLDIPDVSQFSITPDKYEMYNDNPFGIEIGKHEVCPKCNKDSVVTMERTAIKKHQPYVYILKSHEHGHNVAHTISLAKIPKTMSVREAMDTLKKDVFYKNRIENAKYPVEIGTFEKERKKKYESHPEEIVKPSLKASVETVEKKQCPICNKESYRNIKERDESGLTNTKYYHTTHYGVDTICQ